MTLVGFSCLAVVFISVVIMVLIFYKTVVKKKKKKPFYFSKNRVPRPLCYKK